MTDPQQGIRVLGIKGYFQGHRHDTKLNKKRARETLREIVENDPDHLRTINFGFTEVTMDDVENLDKLLAKMKLSGNGFRPYLLLRSLAMCRVLDALGYKSGKGGIDIDVYDDGHKVEPALHYTARLLGMKIPDGSVFVENEADRTYNSVILADAVANLLGRAPQNLPEQLYYDRYRDLYVHLNIRDFAERLRLRERKH